MFARFAVLVVLLALASAGTSPAPAGAQGGPKYNPEEFLKMPLYTRDYPPCKYC